MKLLQISILAHSLHAEKNCRGKNEETRKHNSDVQRQSTQVLLDCQQKVAAEQWSSLTGQIQSNLMNYMAQYDEKARADRLLCTKMRDVYAPLKFEKPESLECFYETVQNTVDCGDADQYDTKCETGKEFIYSPPKDEADGKRVPNIVILGNTGAGKSYFCNGLMGFERPDVGVFGTGKSAVSCTRKPRGVFGHFFKDLLVDHGVESMAINVYDTPGFADSNRCQIEANKQRILEKFDKPIDMFGYLLGKNPRINANQQLIFKNLNEWTMGNIWSNLVIIFGRSTFHPGERTERYYNEESLTQTLEKRLQEIKDLLWDMAREGNWEKTYLDVETKKITSKKLTKEDFNNIKYSALNVNQNTKCPFIMQKTTPDEKDQHCWRMATLTSSFDYEAAPISSSNPFLILKNPRINHPFAVEEDKWILIEEAKRFQKILKENMNHPVSPAKEFWRKEYEKNMQDYNLSFEELKMGNNSLTKILGDAGIDNTHCKEESDKFLMENERKESVCPKWGVWISGQCDASCGNAKKKITRECFLGDQSVETNECAKEYSTDSENEKYEPCFHLPKCSMGSWKNIGKCSKSCGGGKQAQERECNGNYCGSQGTIQMIDCNTEKCPSIWSSWGQFGPCSVTCGTGQKTRSRFGIEGDIKGEIETNSEYCHPGSCYCYVSRARNDGSAGCGTYHADCRCSNGRSTQVGQPIYDHGIFGSDCRASGPSTKIKCEKWCGETCRNL